MFHVSRTGFTNFVLLFRKKSSVLSIKTFLPPKVTTAESNEPQRLLIPKVKRVITFRNLPFHSTFPSFTAPMSHRLCWPLVWCGKNSYAAVSVGVYHGINIWNPKGSIAVWHSKQFKSRSIVIIQCQIKLGVYWRFGSGSSSLLSLTIEPWNSQLVSCIFLVYTLSWRLVRIPENTSDRWAIPWYTTA